MKDGLLFQALKTYDKFEIHKNLAYSKSGTRDPRPGIHLIIWTRDLGTMIQMIPDQMSYWKITFYFCNLYIIP